MKIKLCKGCGVLYGYGNHNCPVCKRGKDACAVFEVPIELVKE